MRSTFSLIALTIALGSCAQPPPPGPSRPIGPVRSLAELIATLPPGGTTTTGVAYASIDLSCGGKTYTIKTGTDGGKCDVTTYPTRKTTSRYARTGPAVEAPRTAPMGACRRRAPAAAA